ncbi:hypothetical protein IGL98_001011 [Enterococcus sp. DIV0840]|uniref:scabin-related ADP-ribosyltransferase n=1 Tax=Enterococcus TaxID=1350 RepID=UPI001A8FF495|nr:MULTISPECIES: RICIN domain-containing protein [Enterococcus]MBO0436085.1 RICIN domain-containing protein [Enterococcus sp. DIV0849a]MBO0473722.1 RICIN domain-containing protein [Enterococcus ureasiticus]
MKYIKKSFNKVILVFLVMGMLSQSLTLVPIKVDADNNISKTNGAEAAVVTAIAQTGVRFLHNLIRSTWASYFNSGEPVWRSNENDIDRRQLLLRHDARGPNDIFTQGFALRNQHENFVNLRWNLGIYVSGRYRNRDNPFVSTTRPEVDENGQIVRQWTPNSWYQQEYIYEIFAPGGIDINASLNNQSPYPEQLEITFPGGIRPEFIRSVRQTRRIGTTNERELVRIYTNPNFRGVDGLPEIVVPEGIEIIQWNPENTTRESLDASNDNILEEVVDPMKRPGSLQRDPFKDDPKNPRRIADGIYQISPKLAEHKVIDVNPHVFDQVIIDKQAKGNDQKWRFVYHESKKAYSIHGVEHYGNEIKTHLEWYKVGSQYVNRSSEPIDDRGYWVAELTSDNYYIFRNYESPDQVLDLAYSNIEDGTRLTVYQYRNTDNQKWLLKPESENLIADGEYLIMPSSDNTKVVSGVSISSSEPLLISSNYGYENSKWKFIYDDKERAYKIQDIRNDGKYLTWQENSDNYAVKKLYLNGISPDISSYWIPERGIDGNYILRNKKDSTKVLSNPKSKQEVFDEIKVESNDEKKSQKWHIKKVQNNPIADGEYQISTILDSNKAIDVDNSSVPSVVINTKKNTENQKWRLTYDNIRRAYTIRDRNDDMNSEKYNLLIINDNGDIQKEFYESDIPHRAYWRIEVNEEGRYSIRNYIIPGRGIEVPNSNINNGTKLKGNPYNEGNAQKWQFQSTDKGIVEDGVYNISSKLNYKKVIKATVLDAEISSYIGLKTQGWRFEYDSDKKAYRIFNDQYTRDGLRYQHIDTKIEVINLDILNPDDLTPYWLIEYDVKQGGYLIRSLYDPYQVVALNKGEIVDKAKIYSYDATYDANQIWNLSQ